MSQFNVTEIFQYTSDDFYQCKAKLENSDFYLVFETVIEVKDDEEEKREKYMIEWQTEQNIEIERCFKEVAMEENENTVIVILDGKDYESRDLASAIEDSTYYSSMTTEALVQKAEEQVFPEGKTPIIEE